MSDTKQAVEAPLQTLVRPRAWMCPDSGHVIRDSVRRELEGQGWAAMKQVERYTVPLVEPTMVDCRTCGNYATAKNWCIATFRCHAGNQYKASGPVMIYMRADDGPGLSPEFMQAQADEAPQLGLGA